MTMGGNGNAALYFVARNAAGDAADKAAFIEGDGAGRSITYRELDAATDRMVGLFQRFDIRREERAAMLVLDELAFPTIFWGALKAGVQPVALNTLLSRDVYEVILNDCRATSLFVSAPLLPTVAPLLDGNVHIRHVFIVGDAQYAGAHAFDAALAESEAGPTAKVTGDDCAFWLYSSGSTGQPKGVRHMHRSLQATSDTYAAQVLGIEADDVVHSAAKLFFAYGLGNGMTFPMSVGATTVLYAGRPTPDGVSDLIAAHRPTVFCGVPTLYAALLASWEAGDGPPEGVTLRRCISAGEALPEEVGKRWAAIWDCDILDGVGSTEMLHIFLSNAPGDVVYGTSGKAVPGYEVKLVDEEGAAPPQGEVGELLVDGPSSATDYWNQRERSRATFEGRWTRTGDKYFQDADGRYVYCGRTDDMFKVSGIWLAPFEVEQALISHADVLEAAVIARRDDEGLEKPMAYVVLKSGAGDDMLAGALKDHVKTKVGMWKYPRWIEFADELPKTATGKIQRFKLRAEDS